jgi:hypothetical protein
MTTMSYSRQLRRNLARCLASIATLAAVGCGSELGSTVHGIVSVDGQTLPTGTVSYHPLGEGAVAYGQIDSAGKYSVKTGASSGLAPGEYRVTVVAVEVEPATNSIDSPAGRRITPDRYQDVNSTDLRFQIRPGSNTIDLQLTSSS